MFNSRRTAQTAPLHRCSARRRLATLACAARASLSSAASLVVCLDSVVILDSVVCQLEEHLSWLPPLPAGERAIVAGGGDGRAPPRASSPAALAPAGSFAMPSIACK